MRFAPWTAAGLSLAIIPAAAILVADDSPCGTLCGNVLDATSPDDITCSEDSYMSGSGAVYQQCVSCELSSTYYTDKNETDTRWLLYNLRYASAYCLFGVPSNDDIINTPCITSTACGPFRDAMVYKNLSSKVDEYAYCDLWPVNRTDEFSGCTSCLQASNEFYLSNFFTVLQAGCEQKPAPGITLSIDGSVFSDDIVNVTSPTPTASVNPDWFDHGAVSLGGKVGIAFGGFAFLLFLVGFFIVWNGKRRRRAFLRRLETKQVSSSSWPGRLDTMASTHDFLRETPLSQRPLRNWDDSPMSARSEKPYPQHVSPFASQYSSPVSATETGLANWPVMGAHPQYHMHQGMQGGSAMMAPSYQYQMSSAVQDAPAAGAPHGSEVSSLSDAGKGKEREREEEAYEMQPVEGGVPQGMASYHAVSSNHQSVPQQGYYDERQTTTSPYSGQYQPGQMFPNMYQQHQQRSQQGLHGFEDDVKK